MAILKSLFYFVLAGIFEIGGGYLFWLWLRKGKTIVYGLFGAIVLILNGIVPTLRPANFGRVYAAYGGIFIALSIFWGWKIDRVVPDKFDLTGGFIALIGVCVIMYWQYGFSYKSRYSWIARQALFSLPPGIMPRVISGSPNFAFSEAIRKSQVRASSQPPPRASPLWFTIYSNSRGARRNMIGKATWPPLTQAA